ncbi:MFS transporter [Streptomyces tendae]|uniref:MFS transporter n=1 Tax=Streptomyces tendae TaxID=1932 RepID=UPI002491EA65|nr:MFS transporter [Streptomyces tendae]
MARTVSLLRELIPPPGVIRILVCANLARTVGTGIIVSMNVLFFTRSVGISAQHVGLGLSCAAVIGMLTSVPTGHLADKLGGKRASMLFVLLQGVTACGYTVVGDFGGFLVAASVAAVTDSAANAARGALVADLVKGAERVRARAYLRSATNVGVSVGALLGGWALSYDTRGVYLAALLGCGAFYAVGALVYLALPKTEPVPRPPRTARWVALTDGPYAAVSAVNAVLVMNGGLLTVALPIWITERTSAPAALFSGLLLVNTVMVVLLQVRMSRNVVSARDGAFALRRAGVLLAVCCAVFAAAHGHGMWAAVILLVLGTVIHVFGELLYSAGSWAVSYELAAPHAQGQYQGFFGLSSQLGTAMVPSAATALLMGFGWWGWLLLAAVLLAAGTVAPRTTAWAERNRPWSPQREPVA